MSIKGRVSGISHGLPINTRQKQQERRHTTAETAPIAAQPDDKQRRQGKPSPPPETSHTLSNAFDAIALLETANSALERIFATLQQARELAQQASHSSADQDRGSANRKLQHHLSAADGIAATTTFKGHKILHGGLGNAYFRLDLGSGRLICVDLDPSLRCAAIGTLAHALSANLTSLFGIHQLPGSYTTPAISDLNFFSAPRHASFSVDGIPAGLFRDWRGRADEAAMALQHRLNGPHNAGDYSVTHHNQCFTISHSSGKAPVLSAASMRGTEFIGGITRSAPAPLHLTLLAGDFTIKVGSGSSVSITGHFSRPDELVGAINAQQPEATAYANPATGRLELSASTTLTIGGKLATSASGLGFAATSYPPAGSLATANLLDPTASREALLRIDAALTTITGHRITYSKLLQRFYQAISQIQATQQRGGSAPPISDATQATDSLSRACRQLPQQTTTTLQAQANAVPNNVRQLLDHNFQETPLCFCHLHCEEGKERCP